MLIISEISLMLATMVLKKCYDVLLHYYAVTCMLYSNNNKNNKFWLSVIPRSLSPSLALSLSAFNLDKTFEAQLLLKIGPMHQAHV